MNQLIEEYHLCPKYKLMNEYSYAYSLLTSRYIVELIRLISKIEHINSNHPIKKLFGADKDFIFLYKLIYAQDSSFVIKKN